ncbi:MAG: AMP-binding protein [Acidimicrobiales bacterium]
MADQWTVLLEPSSRHFQGESAIDAAALLVGTLPAKWSERWTTVPDRPVLWTREREWVTGGDLDDLSRRAAGALRRHGVSRGDRIALCGDSSLPMIACYLGALRSGVVVVPMNAGATGAEILRIAGDAGVSLVVHPGETLAGMGLSVPVVAGAGLLADPGDARTGGLDELEPGDAALICFTSGTTGRPKGAVITHGNLYSCSRALEQAWRWQPEDRLLLTLPLSHVHGLCFSLNTLLLVGASAVVAEKFDPGWVTDAVAKYDATMFFGVPTMYHRLVTDPDVARMAQLRLCVSGSAPLAPTLFEKFQNATGHPPLERYGLTEALVCVSNPYEGLRVPGSVGLPLPGVEVGLDPEGIVHVRSPSVFAGYYENPAATADAVDADGWLRTGDIGAVDDHGYLKLLGRNIDLIVTGGYNVYAREIENALLENELVSEAAVVGMPSEEWGEEVVAFVVPGRAAVDEEDLLGPLRRDLAGYKRPRRIRFIDELPRNHMGKVQKHHLIADQQGAV